jgi:hypothetical protein
LGALVKVGALMPVADPAVPAGASHRSVDLSAKGMLIAFGARGQVGLAAIHKAIALIQDPPAWHV